MFKMLSSKPMISLASVATVAMFTACSSTPDKPEVPDCVFPNTAQAAPGWVCDEPVPGIEISAVGIAEPSKAGYSYMKDMASADARGRLAEQVQTTTQKMVKSYVGTTGVASTETLDRVGESVIKTIANQDLVGSKVYKTRTGPRGRLFVLMGMDSENAQRVIEQAVRTSMNNDNALWQQFKAKQSFDEMAKDIARQPLQ